MSPKLDIEKGAYLTRSVIVAVVLAVLLVPALSAAGSALAARGGVDSPTTASCSVTPNVVARGSPHTIVGSGFTPNQMLQVVDEGSGWFTVLTDSAGAFSLSPYTGAGAPYGTNTVSIYVRPHHKRVLVASCSYQVV